MQAFDVDFCVNELILALKCHFNLSTTLIAHVLLITSIDMPGFAEKMI